jgi:hypothetical protein
MSIFRHFFVKEKPVFTGITRGLGGFGFGAAAAGGGDDSGLVSPDGHSATGGIISDFDDGGTIYRSHTFLSPGTFVVTALSTVYPAAIEYLVVGGGGGGGGSGYGSDGQGAGGAGGLRSNHPSVPAPLRGPSYNVSATTYTVEVGLGAFGGKHAGGATNANNNLGRFGKSSNFYPSPVSYPNTAYIRAPGGGRGGAFGSSPTYRSGEPGGSGGGGAGGSDGSAGSGNAPTDPNWPQTLGNDGGARGPNYTAGGGGGFTSAGQTGGPADPGDGGAGINLTMETGTATGYAGGGAGGGGGPGRPNPSDHGVATHGGGSGGNGYPDSLPNYLGGNGRSGSGGGGGGSSSGSGSGNVAYDGKGWGGGDGGPGIVVVRYQIGQKNTAKATGGSVSFYNNKVIHTFRNPGTFTATESLSCEVVLVGGGAGGGYQNAGGGGAGGYRVVTSHPVPAAGHAVTVGEFGVGLGNGPSTSPGPINALRNGGATTLATPTSLTVDGGGAGGNEGPGGSSEDGQSNGTGSAGGGGRYGTSSAPGGTYGNDGGAGKGPGSTYVAGGGGGGAGGAGEDGSGPTSEGGHGGLGVQLPTTFRDPNGFKFAQGPDDSYYWVAGGGGGGSGNPGGSNLPRGGTGPSGAPSNRCGGGGGGTPYNFSSHSEDRIAPNSQPGMMGTGGGGGGGGEGVGSDPFLGPRAGSPGGSGILLIAYPA